MQRNIHMSVLGSILVGLLTFSVQGADIESLRLWRSPDNTRLVFDLSGEVQHKVFPLRNPERLVIDIQDSQLQANLTEVELKDTPITSLRSARKKNGTLRVVLDLNAAVTPRSFSLKPNQHYGHRLVVDLADKAVEVKPVTVADISSSKRRDIVIAIDAGHGGEDPGAIGPRRLKEKNVTLGIAQKLAKKINARKGYKAVLVRNGDYYVGLKKRRDFAREKRADLMISIHADAFNHKRARGASVFALSTRGATSETARYLAQVENESDLIGGVGEVSLDDKDDVVKGVLVDLSMTATLNSSLDVGSRVLKEVGKIATLHKRQVEQAGFAVLKRPDIPSILVETGFISNPQEARQLASSSYQNKMAAAIFDGVKDHFWQSAPEDTYIAWKKRGGRDLNVASASSGIETYIIAKGDTLSAVAKRYNTTVSQLIALNNLKGTSIWVGQKLKVPSS